MRFTIAKRQRFQHLQVFGKETHPDMIVNKNVSSGGAQPMPEG